MNDFLKYSVGIDVAKEKFDCCISVIARDQSVTIKGTRKFDNTIKGIKSLIEWSKNKHKVNIPMVFLMEATGVYHENLVLTLFIQGLDAIVVLPNKAKKYMQSFGYKSKNDKIDARGLSRMGAEQHLDLWHPYSENIYPLRSLTRHNEDLQQERTSAGNKLEAQTYSSHPNKIVCKQLNSMLKLIDKQIDQTKSEINNLIENDVILKEKFEKIETIKGVGRMTVATIIAETNGFTLFNNMRQLTSFAGYDIVEKQSGNTSGKTRISKRGNSHIRRALHMPSFCAVKYDPQNFGVFYKRVYKNTGYKMKGYTAVQRKILCLIYTLWKKNEVYIENYEELKNKGKLEKKDIETVLENKETSGEEEQKSLFLQYKCTEKSLDFICFLR